MTTQNMIERAYSTTPTASTIAEWDANVNLSANNNIEGYTTTATAASTTTLLVGSTFQQYFTGSTTQTVALPVTSTLVLGQAFYIVNNSSGVVTVQSSGGNTIQAMAASTWMLVTCILTSGTGTASWSAQYSSGGGGGSSNLSGAQFNFQQGSLLTLSTIATNNSWVDTGVTVNITPTSSSNTVLVRAVINGSASSIADLPMFRFVRNSTAIGIGTATGSGTQCTSSNFINTSGGASTSAMSMEWLDSPSSTSSTTYKVQVFTNTSQSYYMNSYLGTSSSSVYPLMISTISVCEVGTPPGATQAGTINSGTAGQLGYYATSSTAISGGTLQNILGVASNSASSAGYVGELISSVITSGSAVSLATGNGVNITSISVTKGDWDIWGNVQAVSSIGTSASMAAWISTTSATAPDPAYYANICGNSASGVTGGMVPQQPFRFNSTTTVYLSCNSSSGSGSACGGLYARRRT